MSHLPPVFLPEGKNSTAYYCAGAPRQLVVFVHGFSGEALDTWNNFPGMIKLDPAFKDCDVIFYGYESLKYQTGVLAGQLRQFLDKYAASESALFGRKKASYYRKILVVAHSLGAVISRFALLEAIEMQLPWRKKVKLLFFAPAHNGAKVQQLFLESGSGIMRTIGGILAFLKPTFGELKPGSPQIEKIKTLTEQYRNTEEKVILTASVVHATEDLIVDIYPFCFDHTLPESPIRDKNHVTICKPNDTYPLPIQLVKQQL